MQILYLPVDTQEDVQFTSTTFPHLTVKNSSEFIYRIFGLFVPPSILMVSFDAMSLFTCIPVDLALTIIRTKISEKLNPSAYFDIPLHTSMELYTFCLNSNYFSFNNQFFHLSLLLCPD